MDAFYASVEQMDNPALKNRAVIVGGLSARGVVCAASYEARKFGVRSAMSTLMAREKCPDGVYLRPRMERYAEISEKIMGILLEYSDLVEPLSLDEAYLDVTTNKKGVPLASTIAKEIKHRIRKEIGLTASAGAGPNKFIAKLASDFDKPDGLVVVPPEKAWNFIAGMGVNRIPGVGPATEKRLREMGIAKIKDLAAYPLEKLLDRFGKTGAYLSRVALGEDERPVQSDRESKSIGEETTFEQDLLLERDILPILEELAFQVERRLFNSGLQGRTITLKVKTARFKIATRSKTGKDYLCRYDDIMAVARELVPKTVIGRERVRLVGISVSNFFRPPVYEQMRLFE